MNIKLYIKVFIGILSFFAKRHPYSTVGLGIWIIGCIGISGKTKSMLGLALIFAVVCAMILFKAIWHWLEDLGSSRMKAIRKQKKQLRNEQLIDFLKKELN